MTTQARRFEGLVGFAKETTYGTGVNPTILLPVTELSDQLTYDVTIDEGLRGIAAMDFKSIQGAGHSELSFGGHVYPEEIGTLLKMIMGAEASSGSGPYEHAFTLGASPGSLTIESQVKTGTNGTFRYTGCRIGQMVFSFNAGEGTLTHSTTAMGKIPTNVTIQSLSDSTSDPFRGWQAVVTSSNIAGRVISGEVTLSRDLQVVHTGADTQDLKYLNVGPLRAQARIVCVLEALATDFAFATGHTTQAFELEFDYGSSTTQRTLTFTMSEANFADEPQEIDRSAVGSTVAFTLRGLYNATDAGPVAVTLTNTDSAAY